MSRPDDAEVPTVERRERADLQALRNHDKAGVGAAEAQVGVGLDQLGNPPRVGGRDRFDLELAVGHRVEEARFCGRAELPAVR